MMQITPEMKGMPTAWAPYFAVADCDATVDKIKSLGGKVYMGPHEIPNVGRFAVCADPQGAMFNIIRPSAM
jgi:predicted enzyme related to lactoylglutathione lyase